MQYLRCFTTRTEHHDEDLQTSCSLDQKYRLVHAEKNVSIYFSFQRSAVFKSKYSRILFRTCTGYSKHMSIVSCFKCNIKKKKKRSSSQVIKICMIKKAYATTEMDDESLICQSLRNVWYYKRQKCIDVLQYASCASKEMWAIYVHDCSPFLNIFVKKVQF